MLSSQTVHTTETSPTFRFEDFELDLADGELRKSGGSIKIPPQPLKLLALLVSNPGKTLTRDDIQRELWGNETFVDFEQCVNHYISQIRSVLGDDAERPTFIQTLPRRGYRFISAVDADHGSDRPECLREAAAERASLFPIPHRTRHWWLLAVAVVLGGALAIAYLWSRHQDSPRSPVTLVVIPFENLGSEPHPEYFASGITEAVTNDLAQVSGLRVVSQLLLASTAGSGTPVSDVIHDLHADYVLTGKVVQVRDQVRITAELMNPRTHAYLWAKSYQRNDTDILALQVEVAEAITDEVDVKLTAEERKRLDSTRSVDPVAYEAYLEGRFFWNKRTPAGIEKALGLFTNAINIDPTYPPAYSGVADSYLLLGALGDFSPETAYSKASAATATALRLNPNLAEAHASFGRIRALRDWNWSEADREFATAVRLNPSYGTARQWWATCLVRQGRLAEAAEQAEKARDLDPLSPVANSILALVYYAGGRNEQAVKVLNRTIEMYPDFSQAHMALGRAYLQEQNSKGAIEEIQRALTLSGNTQLYWGDLGYAYAVSGQGDKAQDILRRMQESMKTRYISPCQVGLVYLGLKQPSDALINFGKCSDVRDDSFLVLMKADPRLDPIKSDPMYQSMMHAAGLAQ